LLRRHLFEFGDQSWFPARLRDALTSYLVAAYRITPFPKLWAQQLAQVLTECGLDEVVDLGSGSGGPVPLVMREMAALGCSARFTLTDLYPPATRNETPDLRYWPEPVDAAHVPSSLRGARTMFASFHHFRPVEARQILRDAFEQRRPICVFEGTTRTPAAVATTLLIPLLVLFLTPSIRPLSAFQLLFTYIVPVLPLLSFWDGFVSQLRTYSVEELGLLTADLASPDYRWDCGALHVPGLPAKIPYLIGCPCTPAG
jgi:hypothetical protein